MILCCGEALIDMLPRETNAGEAVFAPYPGGAVFNTAIALGRLGAQTGFFCPLSDDLFGERLRDALEASDVDHARCPAVDRPCTLAFVTLTDGQARYAFYDTGTALRDMAPSELPTLDSDVTALFFGGISLVGDPCGEGFATLCADAGDRVVMLDPNIRPGFIRNEATYRARLDAMLSRADIVKVSDEDLHWLMGAGDVTELAQALRERGPTVVIVTEGAQGARAFYAGGVAHAAANRVEVVDTVGAGDTFNAGFLAALDEAGLLSRSALPDLTEDALRAALALGAQVAAVTVSRAGANPPRRNEL
ncbi:carbohydrate kinase [Roseibaca sp. V10]|uniref:Carbohydrate kinase n=1 Tax=Roseinatronobacter domitianus TaxID=2940293 RepID=A0ABT0LXS0_9RHOB|nr:carbohydrate kinase [Roseibaca domitiana]MCL1627410.1 carbohydrate kinase [Roseibaca domitiana]